MTKSERGILSEWWVVRDRLACFDEALVVHRKRTPYAEIDLLFARRRGPQVRLTMIEVKSVVGDIWRENLISTAQLARLKRARLFLQIHYRLPVALVIATVTPASVNGRASIRYFQVTGNVG